MTSYENQLYGGVRTSVSPLTTVRRSRCKMTLWLAGKIWGRSGKNLGDLEILTGRTPPSLPLNHQHPKSPLHTMSNPALRLLCSPRIPVRRVFALHTRPIPQRTRLPSSRSASTATTDASSLVTRLKNLLYGTSLSLFVAFGYLYVTDTRAGIHQWLSVPALRWLYQIGRAHV